MRLHSVVALVVALSCTTGRGAGAEPPPADAADLFRTAHVWSVELRFAPEAWAAMEPKAGGSMLTVMGRMGEGRGRGPADLLAAGLLRRGDRDRDGRLDRAELGALADRWFTLWDNTRSGRVDLETLRAGLKATLDPEGVFEGKFPVILRAAGGKRNGLSAAAGVEFQFVRVAVAVEGAELSDAGVRYKGNGTFMESRATPKRPLKLDLNHFVKGRKLAGRTKLNLHCNVTDPSNMVEPIALSMFRDAGVPAPRTSYAQVYLTVPPRHEQTYLGLYSLVENVDKDFAKERFGSAKGAIFKPVTPNLFADLGDTWQDFEQAYDPKTEVTEAQKRRVMEFSKLMSYATDADLAAGIRDYLDLDQFARFMAVTVYLASMDSILSVGQNYYLYLDPATDRFQFIPWDHDHSFGRIFGNQDELARLDVHAPWPGNNRFLERVFNVPAFKELYLARLREFTDTVFSPQRLAAQVDEIAASIRPSVEGESAQKLKALDEAVADAPRPKALKFVKAFSAMRTQSVRDQLAGTGEAVPASNFGFGAGRSRGAASKPQGRTLAAAMMNSLDADHDDRLTRAEFTDGFARWFEKWPADHPDGLSEEQLRDGIRADILPPPPATAPATPGR